MIDSITGYRFNDLLKSRIVSSRSDLLRKQRELGFPRPIKTGDRSAWWPADEVHTWLQGRIALRDDVLKTNSKLPRSPPAAARKSLPSARPRRAG
jgi:predicted DNA-binding transcriptional regulator AlpA